MDHMVPVTHDLPGAADSLISSCRGSRRKVISWELWTEADWAPRIRQGLGFRPERIPHFYCILFGDARRRNPEGRLPLMLPRRR